MIGVRGDWDRWAQINFAKETAMAEGRVEGKAEGRVEGRDEVLDLMAQGFSLEQIKDILKRKP